MAPQFIFIMKDLRKIGVLGANGAGKSTLLRIMAGVDQDFLGEAKPADGVRIGFLAQEPRLDPDKDVRGNVEEGVAEIRGLLTRFDEINARLGEPLDPDEMEKVLEEQARVQDAIEAAGGWDLDRTVEIAMDALRVPPGDADVATLSGGEVRRVALCRLLLQKPDLLLLDEPTNHLDAESVAWLERFLKDYQTMLAEGGKERDGTAEIIIPPGPRLGDVVVQAEHLFKGYGDRLLIEDLSFSLPRGGIVGVIGANGAGKTTLFRMITGQEKPDQGALRVGETVQLAYVDQSRDSLDAKKNVWEEI